MIDLFYLTAGLKSEFTEDLSPDLLIPHFSFYWTGSMDPDNILMKSD
jgi:hypothetical protein